MAGVESSLVDTNILVYAASLNIKLPEALVESELNLCVAPQVFAEFYALEIDSAA